MTLAQRLVSLNLALEDKLNRLCQLRRTSAEYERKIEESDRKQNRLNDELVHFTQDTALEGRSRGQRIVELQRRLCEVRSQQTNLQDACVASYRAPDCHAYYMSTTANLEAKLRLQISVLGRREFRNERVALENLKKREIAQQSQYTQRLEDLHGNLYGQESELEQQIVQIRQEIRLVELAIAQPIM